MQYPAHYPMLLKGSVAYPQLRHGKVDCIQQPQALQSHNNDPTLVLNTPDS